MFSAKRILEIQERVNDTVRKMHLIDLKGKSIVNGYSFLMLVVCAPSCFHSNPDLAPMRLFSLAFYGVIWTVSWVIIFLPKDVFGRWTKEGRLFYLRWLGLKKYLEDFSLLNEKPPESIIL
ncbi:hypothetical protein [Mesotoga sp.]|uniref:DUF2207 family protein n=1 Tax=Mesotoga sp. TaxID=2053577 RepID=UPI00345E08C5